MVKVVADGESKAGQSKKRVVSKAPLHWCKTLPSTFHMLGSRELADFLESRSSIRSLFFLVLFSFLSRSAPGLGFGLFRFYLRSFKISSTLIAIQKLIQFESKSLSRNFSILGQRSRVLAINPKLCRFVQKNHFIIGLIDLLSSWSLSVKGRGEASA